MIDATPRMHVTPKLQALEDPTLRVKVNLNPKPARIFEASIFTLHCRWEKNVIQFMVVGTTCENNER